MFHRDCSCKVHCEPACPASRNHTARCSPGRYPSNRRCRSRGKRSRALESQEGSDCPTYHFRGPTRCHTMRTKLRETTTPPVPVEPEQAFGGLSQRQEPYLFEETRVGKNSFVDPIAKQTWLLPRPSQRPAWH